MLDLSDSKGAHIDQRLRDEPIIWLSSVRPDGRPHLVLVWLRYFIFFCTAFGRSPRTVNAQMLYR